MLKKGHAVETDVAMNDILALKYLWLSIKTTLFKIKTEKLVLVVWFMYVPIKRCSTPWVQKKKRLSRWWMAQFVRSSAHGWSTLHAEI